MIGHRSAIAFGVAVFLVLAGTGVGHALWSSSSSVGTTVSAGTLSFTQAMTGSLDVEYNASIQSATSTVTVTNTGSLAARFDLTLRGTSANSLASTVAVSVWPSTSGAPCTSAPPATAITGTWTTIAAISGTLAGGGTAAYCVHSALAPAAVTASTIGSLTARLDLTATLGSWSSASTIPVSQNAIDSIPPTTPVLTATGTTDAQTTLGWTSTDNVGITGYEVRRNGVVIASATTPGFTFTDTGLSLGTAYPYTVRVSDSQGSWSAESPALAVTTEVIPNPTAWYKIVNPVSGMCVDGKGARQVAGTELIVWPCHGKTNQAWQIAPATPDKAKDNDAYTVAVRNAPSLGWEVPAAGGSARLSTLSKNPKKDQVWTLEPLSTGTGAFRFVNTASKQCLEVPGAPIVRETQLRGGACAAPGSPGSAAQTFILTAVG